MILSTLIGWVCRALSVFLTDRSATRREKRARCPHINWELSEYPVGRIVYHYRNCRDCGIQQHQVDGNWR